MKSVTERSSHQGADEGDCRIAREVCAPGPERSRWFDARLSARSVTSLLVLSGAYPAAAGALTLLGWAAEIPRLTDWGNSGISMMPNAALASVLGGLALIAAALGRRGLTLMLAMLSGLIGAATFVELVAGVDLGVDTLILHPTWGQAATTSPGRMGPPASLSYLMIGAATALAAWRANSRILQQTAAVIGLVVMGIATLSLVGRLSGADALYTLPRLTAIAAQTSSVLLALGLGLVVLMPNAEPMRTLLADSAAALLARRALPAVILIPILLGSLRRMGQEAGLYDGEFGTALLTLIEIVLLAGMVWWTTRAIWVYERALRQSQAELKRQAAQLTAFVETAAIGLHRVGADGVILWANDAELEILGYTREEYIGHHIAEFHADQDAIDDILERLKHGEKLREREARLRCKDGTIRIVVIDSSVLWEDGKFAHTQCFTRDISANRAAQEALAESERRYHEMIDALPAAVYLTDAECRLVYFNPAAVEFSGRVPEIGTDRWCVAWKLYHPDGTPMPHDECPMAIALREGRVVRGTQALAERPDGTRIWFEPYPTPLFDAESKVVGGINMLVDITERKHAELAHARLAAIVESSDDAIVGKNLDGTITSWNPGAERMFGYAAEEAIGRQITLIIPSDRRVEEEEVLGRLRRGEKIDHFETERQRKDGSRLSVSLSVSPLRNSQGQIIGAAKVARDITERKQVEAALAEHQRLLEQRVEERTREVVAAYRRLQLADRMAAVGSMAAGLTHDMNNLLLPLRMHMDALLAKPELSDGVRADLASVAGLLGHLRELARNLSLFSRDPAHEGTLGRSDLTVWRGEVQGLMKLAVSGDVWGKNAQVHRIPIEWDVPDGLPPVAIAPHRLTQAIFNLAHNARQAIVAGATGTHSREGTQASPVVSGLITISARTDANGSAVRLQVRDTGCGMDEDTRRRCLEPFFTTKDGGNGHKSEDSGSGLGLSLVSTIAERAGGRVEIESELNKGTTISLVLPVAAPDAVSPARGVDARNGQVRGRACVSIQDKRLCTMVEGMLGSLQYEVVRSLPEEDSSSVVWVTDGHDASPATATTFLGSRGGRRVFALGGDSAWREAGAVLIDRDGGIASIRRAFQSELP